MSRIESELSVWASLCYGRAMKKQNGRSLSNPRFSLIRVLWCLLFVVPSGLEAQTTDILNLGRGNVTVHIPSSYDPTQPTPLLMMLHGYSSSGSFMENYFQFLPLTEQHGFIYLYPDGSVDSFGFRFWNATDACCNFDGSAIDDVGYLTQLIDAVSAAYHVDPLRIHLVGHSNGGFMAHRMACVDPNRFASIVSFAGAAFNNPANCGATDPVHVLQIHGTLDAVVGYNGGTIAAPYPSALGSCQQWVSRNGCFGAPVSGNSINLDGGIFGNETTVDRWENGCVVNGSVELWSILLGGHLPIPSFQMSDLIFQHILDHPKVAVGPPPGFVRGDTNGDLGVDLSDAIVILNHLFSGGDLGCREAANCNSDQTLDLSDGIYLLGYLFGSGPAPGDPFSTCGDQPMWLDCQTPIACP